MYDIKQVVDKTGFNKNKLYKLIKENEELKKFVVRDNKKIYVLEDGVDILINIRKGDKRENLESKINLEYMDIMEKEKKENEIIEMKDLFNEDMLKVILDQLKEKDKQIQELLTLNKNNQILLREEKGFNKEILEEHFKEVDIKLLELREKMNTKNKKKKWNFFIKKQTIDKETVDNFV